MTLSRPQALFLAGYATASGMALAALWWIGPRGGGEGAIGRLLRPRPRLRWIWRDQRA